ncbi:MAG TPA: histidine kinase dimerization/phospho-acceptor domain-containing protein [Kofleriaceae bacterium]|nr:histidine kinase dimerization/phospho-acceptor domain-containing protein [Kofleriaceae bacterium]
MSPPGAGDEDLSQLVRRVVHDLQNTLAVVQLSASLLASAHLNEVERDSLEDLQSALERGKALVGALYGATRRT